MSIANTAAHSRAPSGNSESVVQTALEQAKTGVQVLEDKAYQATEQSERYIGDHPWTALAVAGSIGVVVGLLLNRRH